MEQIMIEHGDVQFPVVVFNPGPGYKQAILVEGENIPQAYERALLATWFLGYPIPTQYDQVGDPNSRDCTIEMWIKNPLAEPRIYLPFPGGPKELEEYRLEMVYGIHDDWVDPYDPDKWDYTYHGRIFAYNPKYPDWSPVLTDQFENALNQLVEAPFTRRAQVITYYPWFDGQLEMKDPPCLQRLWFRCFQDSDGHLNLEMNLDYRSWDAYRAAFMNLYALAELQKLMTQKLGQRLQKEVRVGTMIARGDSFHIYGSCFEEFQGYLEGLKKRPWEQRTTTSQAWEPYFEEARHLIAAQLEGMRRGLGTNVGEDILRANGIDPEYFEYPKEWNQ